MTSSSRPLTTAPDPVETASPGDRRGVRHRVALVDISGPDLERESHRLDATLPGATLPHRCDVTSEDTEPTRQSLGIAWAPEVSGCRGGEPYSSFRSRTERGVTDCTIAAAGGPLSAPAGAAVSAATCGLTELYGSTRTRSIINRIVTHPAGAAIVVLMVVAALYVLAAVIEVNDSIVTFIVLGVIGGNLYRWLRR